MQRARDLGTFSPKWDVSIKPLLPGPRELWGRRGRKSVRDKGDVLKPRHQGLLNTAGPVHIYPAETVRTCTRSAWVCTRWGPRAERRHRHMPHP